MTPRVVALFLSGVLNILLLFYISYLSDKIEKLEKKNDRLRDYKWGKKDPKPIVEMATEHILNALSQVDDRRTELMRELAELNVKSKGYEERSREEKAK